VVEVGGVLVEGKGFVRSAWDKICGEVGAPTHSIKITKKSVHQSSRVRKKCKKRGGARNRRKNKQMG